MSRYFEQAAYRTRVEATMFMAMVNMMSQRDRPGEGLREFTAEEKVEAEALGKEITDAMAPALLTEASAAFSALHSPAELEALVTWLESSEGAPPPGALEPDPGLAKLLQELDYEAARRMCVRLKCKDPEFAKPPPAWVTSSGVRAEQ